MPKDQKNNFLVKILKFLLIFIAIILIITAGLYGYYFFTKEETGKYISDDFTVYMKVSSLAKVYNNLIDLKAGDLILSDKQYQNFYKSILDLRSSKIARNSFIVNMLDLKTNIIINKTDEPVIILESGFKSVFINVLSNFSNIFEQNNDFSVKTIKKNGYKILKITIYKYEQTFYVSLKNNLIFIAMNENGINDLYTIKSSNKGIYSSEEYHTVQSQIRKDGMAEIYLNTKDVIDKSLSSNLDLYKLLGKFKLESKSAVSFNISNKNIFFNTYTKSKTDDIIIKEFLNKNIDDNSVIKYLPEDTNIFTDLNFSSFEDFYKLFLYLQEGKYDDTLKQANDVSKLLFNMTIDDLLFSWIGGETGVFTTGTSTNPVVFAKIKDKGKFDKVMEKLTGSIVLDANENISFDGIKMKKMKMPEFLLKIVNNFIKGFDTPYYLIQDDFIYFSMDGEPLANLVNSYKNNKTIMFDTVFKETWSLIPKKSNIFVYFNLGTYTPKLLSGKNMFFDIMKLYEKGAMTVNINNSSIKLDIAVSGINEKKARLYPGFPKTVPEGIASPVICENITGSEVPELIYLRNDKQLIVSDINNSVIDGFPVKFDNKCENEPIVFDFNGDGAKDIALFDEEGVLYKFSKKGEQSSPFPLKTPYKGSFYPVICDKDLLFFSNNERKMYFMDESGNARIFGFDFNSPILAPPSVYRNSIFAFYPKSFSGTIFLTDNLGKVQNGWENIEAGGIAYGSPIFSDIDNDGNPEVIFLTQAGTLNVWKIDGSSYTGFPLKLDGVFYTQPVTGRIGNIYYIYALNKDGVLYVISTDGKIFNRKEIKDADNKERKLFAYDCNKDGNEEIFIYGGTNNILAYDEKQLIIAGFPAKGSFKPDFADIDSDGFAELIVSSFDKNIYIYTLPH